MKKGDVEGDTDSDCLMIDLNNDGKYGSEKDLIVDWFDINQDGKADWQLIVDNNYRTDKGKWTSHYIWFQDLDNDGIFGYVNWRSMKFEGWDHSGRANFFTDYNGQSLMLKVHITTWNIDNLEYNWENPFLFYDEDNDGLTEMAIRMVDEPREMTNSSDTNIVWSFSKNISMVQMTFDLDNDNSASNELDFDLSLKFKGKGFDYSDQAHNIAGYKIAKNSDKFFDDPRIRHLKKLIYPDHKSAYPLTFERGDWDYCWLIFDEDDDCHRWERVEFYDPKDPYLIGSKNGGLDHNPQADASGDRGEWDSDFSGKGNLYISPLDGKIHLFGAETGYWRIDQNALYFQGWQGWRGDNLQPEDFENIEPEKFGIIKYEDTDLNGFFDKISYDIDGNKEYELSFSLLKNGISDSSKVYKTALMKYDDFKMLFEKSAQNIFKNASDALDIAKKYGLNPDYYSIYKNPKSLQEYYHNGYWMSYYVFADLMKLAETHNDANMKKEVLRAFHSMNWKGL